MPKVTEVKSLNDKVYYAWMGNATEVLKPGAGIAIIRGIPFEAPLLLRDEFEADPYYIQVDVKDAEKVLTEVANITGIKDKTPAQKMAAIVALGAKNAKTWTIALDESLKGWMTSRNKRRNPAITLAVNHAIKKEGDEQ